MTLRMALIDLMISLRIMPLGYNSTIEGLIGKGMVGLEMMKKKKMMMMVELVMIAMATNTKKLMSEPHTIAMAH